MKRIPLSPTRPGGAERFALVDQEDFERVNAFTWSYSRESKGQKKEYAIRWKSSGGKRVKIRMHRYILDIPPGTLDARIVDHLNDDGLDNRRINLAVVESNHENMSRHEGWQKKKSDEGEPWL